MDEWGITDEVGCESKEVGKGRLCTRSTTRAVRLNPALSVTTKTKGDIGVVGFDRESDKDCRGSRILSR
ncbi:hypothetical protein AKJ16_DCAP20580 [Drosera capensis]